MKRNLWQRRGLTCALLALALSALPAMAHHSFAMFDTTRQLTLTGTVRQFQWTNPHCWIQLQVPGAAGTDEWSIQMGAPILVFRGGWKPTTLKSGDKITVVFHPLRDGGKGGDFISATGPDGQPIGAER